MWGIGEFCAFSKFPVAVAGRKHAHATAATRNLGGSARRVRCQTAELQYSTALENQETFSDFLLDFLPRKAGCKTPGAILASPPAGRLTGKDFRVARAGQGQTPRTSPPRPQALA